MIPTRRFVVLAFLASLVALIASFVPGVDVAWLAFDAALLVLATVDFMAGRSRTARIAVERRAAAILSVGRPNPIIIILHNRSDRRLRGVVTDDPVDHASVDGLPGSFDLAPRASAMLRYELTPTRRGKRTLGAVTVRYELLVGLLVRQEATLVEQAIDVYPDVHASRALEMLRRRGREDSKLGSLRVRGGDTEFERLRPYQRGDEPRHVDWRASARKDDLVVRQFQAESNQNVVFAIDIGRSMRGESSGITSIDHALAAALLTADVALRGGDKAGLLTFDDKPRTFVRPGAGRSGGRKLTRAVYDLDAGFAATDYRTAMVFLKTQVKARSLFVVFTTLLDPRAARELASAVKSLVPRHLPLCVLMRDPEVEALAMAPVTCDADVLVRAAAGESLAWREGIVRSLKNAGALVLDANPHDVTPLLVNRYLEIKARRLL